MDKKHKRTVELGRAAATDGPKAAYEAYQREKEQAELDEALEEFSVEELVGLQERIDGIIRAKRDEAKS